MQPFCSSSTPAPFFLSLPSRSIDSSALSAYTHEESSIDELLVALGRVLRGPRQFTFLNDVQALVRREDMPRFREERFLWRATDSPRKGLISTIPPVRLVATLG